MAEEPRWPDRARARIFTQIRILAHSIAIVERWEPRELAATTFSERILQDIYDALREADDDEADESEAGQVREADEAKLREAVSSARLLKRDQPEGWDVRIVGRIKDDGSLTFTTSSVTRVPRPDRE